MSNAFNVLFRKNFPRVIETDKYINLMGNLYDKDDMGYKSKQASDFGLNGYDDTGKYSNSYTVNNDTMNISKYMCLLQYPVDRYGERDHFFGIVPDTFIPNRYYICINTQYTQNDLSYAYNWLVVFEEDDDGEFSYITKVHVDNLEVREILDQDENFLYVAYNQLNQYGCALYRIDKKVYKAEAIYTNYGDTCRFKLSKIFSDDQNIYMIKCNRYSNFFFLVYDKATKSLYKQEYLQPEVSETNPVNNGITKHGYTDALWNYHQNIDIRNFYKEDGKYYWVFLQRNGKKYSDTNGQIHEGSYNNNLTIMCFDSNKRYRDKDCITFFNSTIGAIPALQDIEDLQWVQYNTNSVYKEWEYNNYLYFAQYTERDDNTDAQNVCKIQGIFVFKINPGFELTYVGKCDIPTTRNMVSLVMNSDKTLLLVGYTESFDIYAYNSTTHLYDKANTKMYMDVMSVGFDTFDRIWIQYKSGDVYCENTNGPAEVEVEFELQTYIYFGNDINSYITFCAHAFNGTIAKGKYRFTLSNKAHFSDGRQIYDLNYTGNGVDNKTQIPIVVVNSGHVTCQVQYVKE